MSKKDVIKDKIGLFKLLVGGIVTALFLILVSICIFPSWLSSPFNVLFIFGVIILLITFLFWTIKNIKELHKELEKWE